jgi:hypothetical protein
MAGRRAALVASLAMLILLAALTVTVIIDDGVTPLVLVSFVLLAMIGFGVVGALIHPPEE